MPRGRQSYRRGGFRRGGRTNYAQIRKIVDRACGVTTVHRYTTDADGIAGPNNSTIVVPLLAVADAPDPEVGGDFVTACQALQDSKVNHVELHFTIVPSSGQNSFIAWALSMNPNGVLTTFDPVDLWSNNPDEDSIIARRTTCGAGQFFLNVTDTRTFTPKLYVSRKALARMGKIREDTTFDLRIQNQQAVASTVFGYGRIHTKKF